MKKNIFWVLIILVLVLTLLTKYTLISDTLYFNSLAEQLTYEQIEKVIIRIESWEWLGYILIPMFLTVKISLIAGCLSIGFYFLVNRSYFNNIFKVVVFAESIFLIPMIFKIIWFTLIKTNYNLLDLQLFYPLSALSIFDETAVQQNQPWLVYPLQTLNLFEVAYWLLLAKGVSEVIKKDFTKSFELVMASYGTGLVLWIVTIMFLTVTYGV